jgi:hypothetical protein
MQWWAWLVIWGGLVLVALALFAWLVYRIVTKSIAAFSALGELVEKADLLGARAEEIADEHRLLAIFEDAGDVAADVHAARVRRQYRRQMRREARVLRGKLLVSADPHQYLHLLKRT